MSVFVLSASAKRRSKTQQKFLFCTGIFCRVMETCDFHEEILL